jgi:VIT1/CCC1 family predicted Fe2+/Mn2+ transporter
LPIAFFGRGPVQRALRTRRSVFVTALSPESVLLPSVVVSALVSLAAFGGLAAKIGGAKVAPGVIRVVF